MIFWRTSIDGNINRPFCFGQQTAQPKRTNFTHVHIMWRLSVEELIFRYSKWNSGDVFGTVGQRQVPEWKTTKKNTRKQSTGQEDRLKSGRAISSSATSTSLLGGKTPRELESMMMDQSMMDLLSALEVCLLPLPWAGDENPRAKERPKGTSLRNIFSIIRCGDRSFVSTWSIKLAPDNNVDLSTSKRPMSGLQATHGVEKKPKKKLINWRSRL